MWDSLDCKVLTPAGREDLVSYTFKHTDTREQCAETRSQTRAGRAEGECVKSIRSE